MTMNDPQPSPGPARPVVFYDGGCGLCGREIAHYRRLDGAARIHWLDISREPQALAAHGLGLDEAMAVFHVRGADGAMHRGVAGFVELWRHLPYYRRLAWLVTRLGLVGPLERGYARFARWRLGRRGGACSVVDSGAPPTPAWRPQRR